jgi:hypothetical protein
MHATVDDPTIHPARHPIVSLLLRCRLCRARRLFAAPRFPSPDKRLSGILDVLLGVARGCQYIHGRGIIHGDLKPDNVRGGVGTSMGGGSSTGISNPITCVVGRAGGRSR